MKSLRVMTAGRRQFGLQILGTFVFTRDGQTIDLNGLQAQPLRLLRLLAAHGGRCSRDEVIDHLWPDSSPAAGGANLRSLVYRLGRALGDASSPVGLNGGWVTLSPLYEWEIDLVRFDAMIRNARDDISALEEALTLYRGEPLQEDRYEDWAVGVRDRLDRTVRSTMHHLADLYRAVGSYRDAADWLERLLEIDPLDEETLRDLLRALQEAGRRAEGLRVYYRFEERLVTELDLQPDAETTALLHALTAGIGRDASGAAAPPSSSNAVSQAHPVVPVVAEAAIPSPVERFSPPPSPVNFPAPTTIFIGRDRDVSAVRTMLDGNDVRLLTLTGPGGIGKTRLALRVAEGMADSFPHGMYFVSLASVTDPQLVLPAMAGVLDLKEAARESLTERLATRLQGRRSLLLLDNCEHVLDGVVVVADLLRRCPELTVLATSRARLHLSGEREYLVPPLGIPGKSASGDSDTPAVSDAVVLFLDRARAVKPDLRISDEILPALAAICRRLDGLPLAIELAAARVRVFPPQLLLERLERRLPVLTDGARDVPARQRTMRAAIDWSYRLLTGEERALFARLSVFAGGWTLETAESVCNLENQPSPDVVPTLTSLIEKSLVRQSDGEESGRSAALPRFTMLETIREYASEQLEESGRKAQTARRHAGYYLSLVESAAAELLGPTQFTWFDRLAAEHDNLREAVAWAIAEGESDIALDLVCSLFWFWYGRGHWSEARETLETVVQMVGGAGGRDRYAEALCQCGGFAWLLGDFSAARRQLEEGIARGREAGDGRVVALGLVFLGSMGLWQGDPTTSMRLEEEALAVARGQGYEIAVALALFNLGVAALQGQEHEAARARLEEALAVWRHMGDRWGIALGLNSLGDLARAEAQYDQAAAYYDECLLLSRDFGIRDLQGSLLHNLGHVARERGDNRRAASLFREALTLFHVLGDHRGEAECLVGLAASIAHLTPERAARLFGAASMELEEIGAQLHPANQGDYDRNVDDTRSVCGDDVFRTAWEEGRRMTEQERLTCALSGDK